MTNHLFPKTLVVGLLLSSLSWPTWAAPESHDVYIESLQPPKGLLVGQNGQVVVRLSNQGDAPTTSGRLLLFVDGQAAGELQLNRAIAPNTKGEFSIPWAPLSSGKHLIRVEVQAAGPDKDANNNVVEQTVMVNAKVQSGEVQLTTLDIGAVEMSRGLPVDVGITLVNGGDRSVHRVQVTLFEGQQKAFSKIIYTNLPGHSTKDYRLTWIPKRSGKLRLTAVLGPGNSLPDPKTRAHNAVSQEVSVIEPIGYWLEITRVDVPPQARVEQELVASVVVRNRGELDASDVKVVLVSSEGRVSSSRADQVKAGQEGHFELRWTPHSVGSAKLQFHVEGLGRAQDTRKISEKQLVVEVRP